MRPSSDVRRLVRCEACDGSGAVVVVIDDARQLRWGWQGCVLCGGTGRVAGAACATVRRRVRA